MAVKKVKVLFVMTINENNPSVESGVGINLSVVLIV